MKAIISCALDLTLQAVHTPTMSAAALTTTNLTTKKLPLGAAVCRSTDSALSHRCMTTITRDALLPCRFNGSTSASPESDFTVKVDVRGLTPGTRYFYFFQSGTSHAHGALLLHYRTTMCCPCSCSYNVAKTKATGGYCWFVAKACSAFGTTGHLHYVRKPAYHVRHRAMCYCAGNFSSLLGTTKTAPDPTTNATIRYIQRHHSTGAARSFHAGSCRICLKQNVQHRSLACCMTAFTLQRTPTIHHR